MSARVVYTARADKDLQQIDRKTAQRIYRKIEYYVAQDDPLASSKKLKGLRTDLYRYRIGDYRAIFSLGKSGQLQLLKILLVKHRKQVYE